MDLPPCLLSSMKDKDCLPQFEACLHLICFTFVKISKVMVVCNDPLYFLSWLCVLNCGQVYSFMKPSDLCSSPLDEKSCFVEIELCKSFGPFEVEFNVFLQFLVAGYCWDLTLLRSKPSENYQASLI